MTNDQPTSNPQPEASGTGDPTPWNPPGPGTTWEPGAVASSSITEVPLAAEAPRTGRARRVAAIGVATALVAAGGFAVVQVAGGNSGGAESPQAAVEQLIAAANEQDVLGMMEIMLPGERRTFRQPAMDMVAEMTRLELLDTRAKLDGVGGFDIQIDVTDTDVEETGDIAVVSLAGTASATIDQAALPIGDFLVDNALDGERPSGTETESTEFGGTAGDPVPVATVKRDGRWYVSLWYSVAEGARRTTDLALPAKEEAIVPVGADTPEAAARQMIDALTSFNLEAAIAGMNPEEAEALQRYAPLFLPDAQQTLTDAVEEGEVKITVDELDWIADGTESGDQAVLTLTSITATADIAGEEVGFTYADECMTLDLPEGAEQIDPICADENDALLDEMGLGVLGRIDVGGLRVSKVDGKWFVSPMSTAMGAVLDVMRGVDRSDLDEIVDAFGSLAGSAVEGLGVELPGLAGLPSIDDPNASVAVPTLPLPIEPIPDEVLPVDPIESDTVPEAVEETVPVSPADACYELLDTTEATDCFAELLSSATIDIVDFPTQLRFPECGLAEPFWTELYESLDDPAFVALMTMAHECYAAKIAAGEITPEEEAFESVAPECWTGINPSGPNATETLVDEYEACAFA